MRLTFGVSLGGAPIALRKSVAFMLTDRWGLLLPLADDVPHASSWVSRILVRKMNSLNYSPNLPDTPSGIVFQDFSIRLERTGRPFFASLNKVV